MKTRILLITSLFIISSHVSAQRQLCIAFYNQENFFDTIDDPHKNDNEYLPSSKKQWNSEKYRNKVTHMARVIRAINNDKAPDVIGLCEIENKDVIKDLVTDKQLTDAAYNFVHYESPDERSIDNALLYKSKEFTFISSAAYPVHFPDYPHAKTRDIILVKLQAKNDETLVFLVNHFPSRLGGEEKSDAKRYRAASVLRHIYDSIITANPKQAVVIMGDFNDEPTDPSMDSVLTAKGNNTDLHKDNDLFNTMYPLKMKGMGSLVYKKRWDMLDQLIISKGLITCDNKVCYKPESSAIFKKDWMTELADKHQGEPLRTFTGNKYTNGYSDHFPVYLYLQLK